MSGAVACVAPILKHSSVQRWTTSWPRVRHPGTCTQLRPSVPTLASHLQAAGVAMLGGQAVRDGGAVKGGVVQTCGRGEGGGKKLDITAALPFHLPCCRRIRSSRHCHGQPEPAAAATSPARLQHTQM